MTWLSIAIIAPFLYALTNFIDKILLEKYFRQSGIGTIILFSSLLSFFTLPFFLWMDPAVLQVGGRNIFILCIVGILDILILWCYLKALQDEEASVVIVFYQLVPVFGYGLGYFILGETLTVIQIIAMTIIILGTTIVSLEIDSENRFKLRKKTILPMLAACFFWASESVIFKVAALEENVWRSLFWEHVMMVLVGMGIFIFARSYRTHFIEAVKNNSKPVLLLNAFNEFLYMSGNLVLAFSVMLAPVALVLLINSFQTIFVLIIGITLTIFFPKITVEKIQAKHIWQKVIAILITGIGTYLLSF